jgi:CHAT domain-containing protein
MQSRFGRAQRVAAFGVLALVCACQDPLSGPERCAELDARADAARRAGRLQEAGTRFGELAACERETGNGIGEVQALGWQGLMAKQAGELEAAAEHYRRAGARAEELGLEVDLASSLGNLGALRVHQGRITEALGLYEEGLSRLERQPATEDSRSVLADLRVNRASALVYQGKTQEAINDYRVALAQGHDSARRAAQHNLASLSAGLGDFERAVEAYEALLADYRQADDAAWVAEIGASLGTAHLRLATTQEERGEAVRAAQSRAAAERLCGEALEAAAPTSAQRGRALQCLGDAARALGRLEEAGDRYERGAVLWQSLGGKGWQGSARLDLARVRTQQRRLDEAARLLVEASALLAEAGTPFARSRLHLVEADLAREQHDRERELTALEGSLALEDQLRSSVASQEQRARLLAESRRTYERAVAVAFDLGNQRPAGWDRAFALSEAARARGFVEVLEQARVGLATVGSPALVERSRALEEQLQVKRGEWVRLALGVQDQDQQLAKLASEVAALEEQRRTVDEQIQGADWGRFQALRSPEPVALAGVRSALAEEEVLLEYLVGRDRSFVFAVTREGQQVHEIGQTEHSLRNEVARLRHLITVTKAKPDQAELAAILGRLRGWLIEPIRPALAGKRRLTVVAEGPLATLPFEMLPFEPGRPDLLLLDRYEVGYLPSATVAEQLRALTAGRGQSPPARGLVAIANPVDPALLGGGGSVPGQRAALELPALTSAGAEVGSLRPLFARDGAEIWLDRDASVGRILTDPQVRRAAYLHFAVHGLTTEEAIAPSLVLFGGPAPELLGLREIFSLRLSAQMVVLSACGSGLGPESRGEGVLGLPRAFFYAGVPTVVMSLWPIDDAVTAELMTSFYRGLRERGLGKAEALRQAKLELKARGGRPYFWAPFVLFGLPD